MKEIRSSRYLKKEFPGKDRKRRRRQPQPHKIESLVGSALNKVRDVQVEPTLILASHWSEIVGVELAAKSSPGKIDRRGTLHVLAPNAVLASKLHWQSAEIKKNAVKFLEFGVIKSVKIIIVPNTKKTA